MLELKNPKIAVPVVLFAGILWSFWASSSKIYGYLNQVPWQYVFGRGLNNLYSFKFYLYFEEGIKLWKNYLKMGKSGLIGGSGLV